jgi:hypothetical protein
MFERQLLAATSRMVVVLVLFMQAVVNVHACSGAITHSPVASSAICVGCGASDACPAGCAPQLSLQDQTCAAVTQALPAATSVDSDADGFAPRLPLLAVVPALRAPSLPSPDTRLARATACSLSILFCSLQE